MCVVPHCSITKLLLYQHMTPRAVSPGVKRPECEASTHLHKCECLRMRGVLPPLPVRVYDNVLEQMDTFISLPTCYNYLRWLSAVF